MENESDWKLFAVALCTLCIIFIVLIYFLVEQNESLKNQVVFSKGESLIYSEKYDKLRKHIDNYTTCYREQTALANRLATCGLKSSNVIGSGCGKLIYKDGDKEMLIYCRREPSMINCSFGEVKWLKRYCWEEKFCFFWLTEPREYCPKPEGTITIEGGS